MNCCRFPCLCRFSTIWHRTYSWLRIDTLDEITISGNLSVVICNVHLKYILCQLSLTFPACMCCIPHTAILSTVRILNRTVFVYYSILHIQNIIIAAGENIKKKKPKTYKIKNTFMMYIIIYNHICIYIGTIIWKQLYRCTARHFILISDYRCKILI